MHIEYPFNETSIYHPFIYNKNSKMVVTKVVSKKVRKKKTHKMTCEKVIISIDVGVKNLAICVLGSPLVTKNISDVSILLWKCYDVTKPITPPGPVIPVVKTPRKKKDPSAPVIPSGICQNVIRKTGKACGNAGPLNSRGRAYCGVHDPAKKHKPQDTQLWAFNMITRLNTDIGEAISGALPIGVPVEVIIEQQSLSAKKILLQSHLIFGYFVEKFNNAVPVRFVPAYNKLSVYDGPEIACTLKTEYAKRKFMARKHTEYYLNRNPLLEEWKQFFESYKSKQDDISDAFLQGLHHIVGSCKKVKETTTADGTANGTILKKHRRRKVRF